MTIKIVTLLVFCTSVLSAFCQQGADILVGRDTTPSDSMWVMDPAKDDDVFFIKPDKDGRFILHVDPVFPKTVEIGVDADKHWRISLFLEAGDKINIETDFAKNAKFSGKGAMKQTILYQDAAAIRDYAEKMDIKTVSADRLLAAFDSIGHRSIAFLEANKQKISPIFYKQQSVTFLYDMRNRTLGTPSYMRDWGGQKLSASIPDHYWELGKDIDMDDQLLSNHSYLLFVLYTYPDFLRLKELSAAGALDSTLSPQESIRSRYGIIEKYYTGKIRSRALRGALERGFAWAKNVEIFKPLMDQYLALYATPEDATHTLESYDHYGRTNVGRTPPFFTLRNVDGKEVSLKDFAGKVVYMDFWASWCGPCRYEMKEGSPKLHEKFKDNKDVVFLYVSIDDRDDLWKKAISEDNIQGIHLLSPGGFKSQVGQAFNINGIPHYIIIGRDGKIFDNNASRPSEDKTPQKINEALAQSAG